MSAGRKGAGRAALTGLHPEGGADAEHEEEEHERDEAVRGRAVVPVRDGEDDDQEHGGADELRARGQSPAAEHVACPRTSSKKQDTDVM